MTPQELKLSILSRAFQGKLVDQLPAEGGGADLLPVIQEECREKIRDGQIKKFKMLSAIDDADVDFDVPDTWQLVRLGSICQLLDGEKRAGESYPYLEARYLRGKTAPTILTEGKYVTTGSNVILVDGENSGEVFRLTESGYMGSTFKVLFVPDSLLLEYVIYFLQYHKTTLRNNKKGAAIPHLNKDIFFNLVLPIPPLAEQKRIVAKIEKLLPLIDRYEAAWGKLEEFNKRFPVDMQKSILQMAIQGKLVPQRPEEGTGEELFQQIQAEKQRLIKAGKIKKEKPLPEITEDEIPFNIPETWKWVRIGDVFNVGTGMTPLKTEVRFYQNGTIPWVTSSLTSQRYITDAETCVTEYALENTSLTVYPAHTLIVAMYGQGKTRGQVSELLIDATVNQACAALGNIVREECMITYIYYCFLFNYEVLRKKAEGTSQPNLNLGKIKEILIPLPPLAEQKRIVAKLEEILPLCERLK